MKSVLLLALCLISGCSSLDSGSPFGGTGTARSFEAPMARVKPAFISTIASMGMSVSALEVRNGREIIKARKAGSEVKIELEAVSKSTTRARVIARSADEATAFRIIQQAGKILGGT
jgi:formate hydrogenlyase subunit 4